MSQPVARMNTSQEYFAHIRNAENQPAITLIARQMLNHQQCGLKQARLVLEEEELCQAFETLRADYEGTIQEQWAELKKVV